MDAGVVDGHPLHRLALEEVTATGVTRDGREGVEVPCPEHHGVATSAIDRRNHDAGVGRPPVVHERPVRRSRNPRHIAEREQRAVGIAAACPRHTTLEGGRLSGLVVGILDCFDGHRVERRGDPLGFVPEDCNSVDYGCPDESFCSELGDGAPGSITLDCCQQFVTTLEPGAQPGREKHADDLALPGRFRHSRTGVSLGHKPAAQRVPGRDFFRVAFVTGVVWHQATGADRPSWEVVETPFDIDLYDAEQTPRGSYAVGEGGAIVADRGNGWEVVVEGGPSTRATQVRAMDATADGGRLWMVGAEGGLACYDVEDEKLFEYSYPVEMTSTWEGVAVAGDVGEEKGIAADGRGSILPFTLDGHDVDWGKLSAPDPEQRIDALAASPDGVAYAIDTASQAYKTTIEDGWGTAGVVNPDTMFHDLDAWENERVYVAADDGCVYRYQNGDDEWAPIGVVEQVPLPSMSLHDEGDGNAQMAVVGDDNSLYERTGPERWERTELPTEAQLYDLSLGSPDLVVGKNGTVLERERTDVAAQSTGDSLKNRKKRPPSSAGREVPDQPDSDAADADYSDEDAADPPDEPDVPDQ